MWQKWILREVDLLTLQKWIQDCKRWIADINKSGYYERWICSCDKSGYRTARGGSADITKVDTTRGGYADTAKVDTGLQEVDLLTYYEMWIC